MKNRRSDDMIDRIKAFNEFHIKKGASANAPFLKLQRSNYTLIRELNINFLDNGGYNMSETKSHKRAKAKAPGKTEVPISKGRRLDSATKKTATEIERNRQNIPKAVNRLKDSGRSRKVLQVPQPLFKNAIEAMKKKGVSGTVKNLSGTKAGCWGRTRVEHRKLRHELKSKAVFGP
jgi:hypothetical protein